MNGQHFSLESDDLWIITLMYEHFRFQIEDVYEVYKDPGGHYHHFTYILGRLLEGKVSLFQPVTVPAKNGIALVCRVGDLRTKNKVVEAISVEENEQIGIGLWKPSPIKEDVEYGLMEWFHAEQSFDRLDMLRCHPSLYLHKIPSTGNLCPECCSWIGDAASREVLEELSSCSNPQTADLARLALQWCERTSSFRQQDQLNPRQSHPNTKRWWQFWK